MVKFGNVKGANKGLGRESKLSVFSWLVSWCVLAAGRTDNGGLGLTRPAGLGGGHPSVHGKHSQSLCPALGSPPGKRYRHKEQDQLMDWVFECSTPRARGNCSGQPWEGRTRGHMAGTCSLPAQRHWARACAEEHGDRTTPLLSGAAARLGDRRLLGTRILFTLRLIKHWSRCPEKLWSLHLWRYKKLIWPKGPWAHEPSARGGIRDLQGPFLLTCPINQKCQSHRPARIFWGDHDLPTCSWSGIQFGTSESFYQTVSPKSSVVQLSQGKRGFFRN